MAKEELGEPGGGTKLTTGPITPTLIWFALPALGANILQSLTSTLNAIFIGQYLGADGLAATTNANLINFLLLSAVFGFGMASTVIVGQRMGAGDLQGVRRAAGTGTGLFLFLGIVAAVVGYLFAPAMLRLMGTPPDVLPAATIYLRVMLLAAPASLLTSFFAMALRGVGDAVTPLLVLVPSLLASILLNPILIGGSGFLPPLGVAGSALASAAANVIAAVATVAAIYWRDMPIRLKGAELRYLWPDGAILRFMAFKGTPMGLQMLVTSGSAMVLLSIVNGRGIDTVAAYGAANQLWVYVQLPAMACSMAAGAMAAQNIGAGRWDRVAVIARSGLAMTALSTGSVVLLMILFDQYLMRSMLPAGGAALATGCVINEIAAWSFVAAGMAQLLSGIMRASGVVLAPLAIMVVSLFPVRLGAAMLLEADFGADAIWWCLPISASLTFVATALYFRLADWRRGAFVAAAHEAEEFVQSETEPAARAMPSG